MSTGDHYTKNAIIMQQFIENSTYPILFLYSVPFFATKSGIKACYRNNRTINRVSCVHWYRGKSLLSHDSIRKNIKNSAKFFKRKFRSIKWS